MDPVLLAQIRNGLQAILPLVAGLTGQQAFSDPNLVTNIMAVISGAAYIGVVIWGFYKSSAKQKIMDVDAMKVTDHVVLKDKALADSIPSATVTAVIPPSSGK